MTIRDYVLLLGIALITLSLLLFVMSIWRYRRFVKTRAVVKSIDIDFQDGEKNFQAVYEFRDNSGRVFEGHSVSRLNYSPYAEGQHVTILYPPDNPEFSRIDSFREKYAWSITFLAMGAIVVLVGLIFR